MDGILRGRLSVSQRLAGRLSIMPRGSPAPEPVLVEKVITANGAYAAADDGADGYSLVTAAVPVPVCAPHVYDMTGGYVMNGTWTLGGDTVCYSDVYAVFAGHVYILALGETVGTRFRAMFSEVDTSTATENVTGRSLVNQSNPAPYAYITFKPVADGFITVTKDNAGTPELKTYVFDLADLIGGVY